MANDSKKLRTMKWLQKISSSKNNREFLKYVFAHLGKFFATDTYILACVEYPEHNGAGFDQWDTIERFTDDSGYLLQDFEYVKCVGKPLDWLERLESLFPHPRDYAHTWDEQPSIDSKKLALAMKGFEINDIPMHMAFTPEKLVISGHNKDVSISVVMMGIVRR